MKVGLIIILVVVALVGYSFIFNYNQTPYERATNTLKSYCRNPNLEVFNITEKGSEVIRELESSKDLEKINLKYIRKIEIIPENEYIIVFDSKLDKADFTQQESIGWALNNTCLYYLFLDASTLDFTVIDYRNVVEYYYENPLKRTGIGFGN